MTRLKAFVYQQYVPYRYRYVIPFCLVVLGVGLVYAAAPGIGNWSEITMYAKLGVSIITAIGAGSLIAAGVSIAVVDTSSSGDVGKESSR